MRALPLIVATVIVLFVAACGGSSRSKDRRYERVTSAAICSELDYSALKETVGDLSRAIAPREVVESDRASCYRMSDTAGAVNFTFNAYASHEEAKSALDKRVADLLQAKGRQAEEVPELLKTVSLATTVRHDRTSRGILLVDGNFFMAVVGFHTQTTSAAMNSDEIDAQLRKALVRFVEAAMPKLRDSLHMRS